MDLKKYAILRAKSEKKYRDFWELYKKSERRFIFGAGKLGNFCRNVLETYGLNIDGMVDNDPLKENCCKPNVLMPNDSVIIASIKYPDIVRQLKQLKIENYAYYEEVALVNDLPIYGNSYMGLWSDFDNNTDKYIDLGALLYDEKSRIIYDLIISYRFSFEQKFFYMAYDYSVSEGKQYFDRIVLDKLNENTVFFDIGGERGTTTYDFYQIVGGIENRCLFFEPDELNVKFAMDKLKNYNNIEYYNKAVGVCSGSAGFESIEGKTGSGKITNDADTNKSVEIVRLDDYCCDNAYIKMDIEGYEMQAIKGMGNFIMKYHPILAVCVYHKADDIWNLVFEILKYYSGYRIFLRHYTCFYTESVMYFIP